MFLLEFGEFVISVLLRDFSVFGSVLCVLLVRHLSVEELLMFIFLSRRQFALKMKCFS